jgi:hypothetical protein
MPSNEGCAAKMLSVHLIQQCALAITPFRAVATIRVEEQGCTGLAGEEAYGTKSTRAASVADCTLIVHTA